MKKTARSYKPFLWYLWKNTALELRRQIYYPRGTRGMKMYKNKQCIVFALVFALQVSLNAQTHTAVPLDDPVYYLIEQAQMRGLCAALPGVKPYSREKILSIVEE